MKNTELTWRRALPRVRALALVTTALLAAGCSALRFGGPEHDLRGSWEGGVTAEGQRISGTMAIEQEGRALEVAFVAPDFQLNAEGTGEVEDDGDVWIELAYDLQCPGNARLDGTLSEDGNTISGSLEATDCTGTVTGSFSFSR